MKDGEFQNLNRLIESVRARVSSLETDVYYLKNHPAETPEWRCPAYLSVDGLLVSYRCEVSTDSYNASQDYSIADGRVVHKSHVTHISLESGQRMKIEWANNGPTK